jgi:hypothetical protein
VYRVRRVIKIFNLAFRRERRWLSGGDLLIVYNILSRILWRRSNNHINWHTVNRLAFCPLRRALLILILFVFPLRLGHAWDVFIGFPPRANIKRQQGNSKESEYNKFESHFIHI